MDRKLFRIFPIKKFSLKDVSHQAVSFNSLLAGFSLESDLDDWCVVFLVILLEGQQGLDEVPILVFDVFGLPPLFTSFVVGNLSLSIPVPFHDVVTHDVGSRPGLGLVQAADEEDGEDEEKFDGGERHLDTVRLRWGLRLNTGLPTQHRSGWRCGRFSQRDRWDLSGWRRSKRPPAHQFQHQNYRSHW